MKRPSVDTNKNGLAPSKGHPSMDGNGKAELPQASSEESCGVVVEKVELRKSITFAGALAILLTNCGGTSIFIVPTTILGYAGSPFMALVIWLVGGIVQATLAYCASELALMFMKAGGPYYFIYQTFGDLAGFVFIWGFLIFIAAPAWALGSYTTSLYLLSIVFRDCAISDGLVKLVAAFIIVTFIAINCTYTKVVTQIQKFFTAAKVLAFIIIIVTGFVFIPTESAQEHLEVFTEGSTTDVGRLALAMFAGFFSFGGWQIITILAEEVKNPEKVIPRALGCTFLVLITACVATNFAFFVVLSKQEAFKSDAIAVIFGEMVHPAMAIGLAVLVSVCSIGSVNVLIMGQPRLLYAAGLNGHMPRMMTLLHIKFKTPWIATMTLGILGFATLASGTVASLVETISLYSASMIFALMLCLLFLRWKRPDAKRPLKVPIVFPIFGMILTSLLIAMSVYEKPRELGMVILTIICGVPVYYVFVKWQRPAGFFRAIDVLTTRLQILLQLSFPET
ncbi:cystine/glutamate transporter [Aplysia californica]|uniref:Cystine/glutamate transporter n=1 Tax=Aplysia californica TaxID=6500 RepID=A0ABM0JLE8_APLCA|nr:cystine/glutamate transporter [Aplysia californica]